jgi:hypothetical protein
MCKLYVYYRMHKTCFHFVKILKPQKMAPSIRSIEARLDLTINIYSAAAAVCLFGLAKSIGH